MKISIIDYYTGNTMSLVNALSFLGYKHIISNKKEIEDSDVMILPGVGSFRRAMNNIKNLGLVDPITKHVKSGKKLIGICLGMQLLFTKSNENEVNNGLNFIKGDVTRLKKGFNKIPNVGHKKTKWINNDSFFNFNYNKFYFTHSYVGNPVDKEDIIAQFYHNKNIYCCGVQKGNIYGFQFHPELSSRHGINLLKKVIEN
jgi:imidazole glycerol-phosphate synthase subunit HisH